MNTNQLFKPPVSHVHILTLFKGLSVDMLPNQAHLPRPSFGGQQLTVQHLQQLRAESHCRVLVRGASTAELPKQSRPGVVGKKDVQTDRDVVEHCQGNTAGISTTVWLPIARKFAVRAGVSTVTFFASDLIPLSDKVYIPEFMENRHYENNGEAEMLVRYSVPQEVIIGRRKICMGVVTFDPFELNGFLLDPVILQQNPHIERTFYHDIYYVFSREIAPLLRKGCLSESDLDTYNQARMNFHLDYQAICRKAQGLEIARREADRIEEKMFDCLFAKPREQKPELERNASEPSNNRF